MNSKALRDSSGLVGSELANNLLDRAFRSKADKVECKLRRGLKITFYYK